MIKNINLKNFKCFTSQSFNLSPLTIFCGSNSAGKSTAIQSILSVAQNLNNLRNGIFKLDGDFFSFGRAKDLLSHTPSGNSIEITINSFKIALPIDELESKEIKTSPEELSGLDEITELLSEDFIYLCAERLGPRSSFDVGQNSNALNIGIYGQFALASYNHSKEKKAINQEFARRICAHLLETPQVEDDIFTDILVREAMRRICPGFSMRVIEANDIDRVYNMYTSGSESIRPVNVGFGVSYVLPIVISASLIKQGGILIIENPEVHLHPRAQSELIKILCELSKTGVQVIIETHSDHIINGIRVFAKENTFNESDNIIYSVTDISGTRKVKEINIDEDGNLSEMDDGFFDQINKDLMRLF